MFKACSRCGKIHEAGFQCRAGASIRVSGLKERKLRSTYRWTQKSKEIRERAHYLCEVCKDNGDVTYEGVEVHHITKLAEDSEGLLDNYNLICLCPEHHKQADDGKLDNDYLRELAKKREEEASV